MITRIWHGRTKPENAEHYLDFLQTRGTVAYLETEGNISVNVWRRKEADCCHFWTVTEWHDMKAVKAFAGDQPHLAKYYPEDEDLLLEFEEYVNHYDSFDLSDSRIKDLIQQLKQVYEGGSWVDESFIGKLSTLTDSIAFQQPLPGVHCIAEIVWHCIYWRTVLIKSLQGYSGYRDETVDALNFLSLESLQQKGWPVLKKELQESQDSLTVLLGQFRDNMLEREYKPGYDYAYFITGMIQHDQYHLGQIGLVKKILDLQPR